MIISWAGALTWAGATAGTTAVAALASMLVRERARRANRRRVLDIARELLPLVEAEPLDPAHGRRLRETRWTWTELEQAGLTAGCELERNARAAVGALRAWDQAFERSMWLTSDRPERRVAARQAQRQAAARLVELLRAGSGPGGGRTPSFRRPVGPG